MTESTDARLRLLTLAFATMATLGACGGGGDSASPAPAPPPASTDVAVAYAAMVGQSHSWNLSGTAQGITYTAQVSVTPGADVLYQGATYHSTALSTSLYVGSQLLGSNVETLWLDETTLNPVFYTESADGSCGLTTSSTQIPAAALLGASGPYFQAGLYESCALPNEAVTQVGTSVDTWSYGSVGGRAFLCLNSTNTLPDGTSSESDCVEVVDSAGTLGTHARIVSTDSAGDTLTLAN